MKKQVKVLKEIYRAKEMVDIDYLIKYSELTRRQIYDALTDLKRRKLIFKNKKENSKKKVYISINDKIEGRIKKVIEND